MDLWLEYRRTKNLSKFTDDFNERYGKLSSYCYYDCPDQIFFSDQLIEYLLSRKKFITSDNSFLELMYEYEMEEHFGLDWADEYFESVKYKTISNDKWTKYLENKDIHLFKGELFSDDLPEPDNQAVDKATLFIFEIRGLDRWQKYLINKNKQQLIYDFNMNNKRGLQIEDIPKIEQENIESEYMLSEWLYEKEKEKVEIEETKIKIEETKIKTEETKTKTEETKTKTEETKISKKNKSGWFSWLW